MAVITEPTQMPGEAFMGHDLIKRFGFKLHYVDNYELTKVDLSARRVQTRREEHYVPREQKTLIKNAIKERSSKIPPIVVTSNDYLVDGNTRVEAARDLGYQVFPALVLKEAWPTEANDAESAERQRLLRALGTAFNARHGRGVDRSELRDSVMVVGEGDLDAKRIAYLLGVTDTIVENILNEERARKRAEEVGLHLNGSVPATQLRVLGSARLNKQPWEEVVRLTMDAGLSRTELSHLINEVKDCHDDAAALDLIRRQRALREDQIREYKAKGKRRPPSAAEHRQRLGWVLGYEDDPRRLCDYTAGPHPEYIAAMERVMRMYERVCAEQRQIDEKWKNTADRREAEQWA